jgi:hypothetical protein
MVGLALLGAAAVSVGPGAAPASAASASIVEIGTSFTTTANCGTEPPPSPVLPCPPRAAAGDILVIRAGVQWFEPPIPTGTITIKVDGATLTTVALSNGEGMATDFVPPPGTVTIEADYSGDANFTPGSTSVNVYSQTGCIGTTAQPQGYGPAIFRAGVWYLRNTQTTGNASKCFAFGAPGDRPVMGSWLGGSSSGGNRRPGVFRNGTWFLGSDDVAGPAVIAQFGFGIPGDIPVAGNWSGQAALTGDTIGVYRNGVFYLRNSNSTGPADYTIPFGIPGDIPVVGDWNGDGSTTIGVFRHGVFYLRNENTPGPADITVAYGLPTDVPVIGDWNNDGHADLGVVRNGVWYLATSLSAPVATTVLAYGAPTDIPLAWD